MLFQKRNELSSKVHKFKSLLPLTVNLNYNHHNGNTRQELGEWHKSKNHQKSKTMRKFEAIGAVYYYKTKCTMHERKNLLCHSLASSPQSVVMDLSDNL